MAPDVENNEIKQKIKHDIERHGYLLERDAFLAFRDKGFQTEGGVGFIDPDIGKYREGDITASKAVNVASKMWFTMELIVECQWSAFPVTVFPRPYTVGLGKFMSYQYRDIFITAFPKTDMSRGYFLPIGTDDNEGDRLHKQQLLLRRNFSLLVTKETPQVVATNITESKRERRKRTDWQWIKDDVYRAYKRALVREGEIVEYNQMVFDQSNSYQAHILIPVIIVGGTMYEVNRDGDLEDCSYCILRRWMEIPERLRSPEAPWEQLREIMIAIVGRRYLHEFIKEVNEAFEQSCNALASSKMPQRFEDDGSSS